MKPAKLFVIERTASDGKGKLYWACSTEHGAGWHSGYPKQAFSRSELTAEIRRLIDEGWFCDAMIRELHVRQEESP